MRAPFHERLLRGLHQVEDGLLAVALGLLVLLSVGQIFARMAFDAGGVWIEPSMRLLILWLAMLGALAATRDGRHIAIDVLPRLLPPLGKRIAWASGQVFAALICALMAWGSVDLVLLERESASEVVSGVSLWVALLILPAGFSLMSLRMLVAAMLPPPAEHNVA